VAASQPEPFDFYRRGPYRDDVPRPDEHLGYPMGSLVTPHDRVVDYFRALASAAPDRVRLETYGRSYEGKPLLLAFVSSERNLDRRERIRDVVQRLAEPRGVNEETASRLASEAPVVVWLDYGNDGDESANVEAAMQVAYQLVAGQGEDARRLRENALVVLNPDHNPESHDRHATWYNAFGIGAADPAAMEHDAPWGVSTNNNHYQVDLNRDGWGLTQRESQAVAAQVLRWRPQVFVDHHGQTDQYFFPPPTRPVNPDLPEAHDAWYETFGRGNAEAFDRHGWPYYVRDVFDLHYPGYFDSWPALHGAIGMTYETDGGGERGLRWRRDDGSVVTFRDGIARHFVASLATVETAVDHRRELLEDFAAFFRSGLERGREGRPARAYVVEPGPDPRRSAVLAATLMRHGIEVQRAVSSFEAAGVRHATGEAGMQSFPAGSWVIDMAQPEARAAATYLRRDVPLDSSFVREQVATWNRNARRGADAPREGYGFYDVTSWSLPLAMGVEAWALDEAPDVETELVTVPPEALSGSGGWADAVPFETPGVEGGVTGEVGGTSPEAPPRARSAYLVPPEREGTYRLVAGLLREGYRLAVSTRPLVAADREFPRGTFVARVGRNPSSLHGRIHELARDAGVEVTAAHTSFPARGDTGPGSETVRAVRAPRVAVAAGEGVDATDYGHTWFTLERRLDYPFTPLRLGSVASGALEGHDVLVVPGGSPSAYRRELGAEGREALARWIERGGVLVGWRGAAVFAADAGLTGAGLVAREASGEGAVDTLPPEERLSQIDALPQERAPVPPVVGPTADPGALVPVPGAVLRAELDLTHWLTLGYGRADLPVLVDGDDQLGLSPTGSNPVVFPEEGELVLSGFTWPGNTARLLRGTPHAVAERRGDGGVVLFDTDPNFRLVWRATTRLFANAVFLGPAFAGDGGGGY
jgi:hypothetical protein